MQNATSTRYGSMRWSSPRRKSLKSHPLGSFEKLEDRSLLAGDLLAGLGSDGILTVLGDDSSNGVLVRTVDQEVPDSLLVTGGRTSVSLEFGLLASVGLTFSSADADDPANGFDVGFPITEQIDFRVSTDGSVPPLGAINHLGTVSFNENTPNADTVTIGNFLIGFDGSRAIGAASGFFVQDTFSLGAVLFDIGSPEITVGASELTIS